MPPFRFIDIGNVCGVKEYVWTPPALPLTVQGAMKQFDFRLHWTVLYEARWYEPTTWSPPPQHNHLELHPSNAGHTPPHLVKIALNIDPWYWHNVTPHPNGQPYGPSQTLMPTCKICTLPPWMLESTLWARSKASICLRYPFEYSPLPLSTCNECMKATKVKYSRHKYQVSMKWGLYNPKLYTHTKYKIAF